MIRSCPRLCERRKIEIIECSLLARQQLHVRTKGRGVFRLKYGIFDIFAIRINNSINFHRLTMCTGEMSNMVVRNHVRPKQEMCNSIW